MIFDKPVRRIAIVGTGVIGASTPDLKRTIAEGVLKEAGDGPVERVAQEENELLVGLLKMRGQSSLG